MACSQNTGNGFQQGGFAVPVGSEQSDHLFFVQFQRSVSQNLKLTVVAVDVLNVQLGCAVPDGVPGDFQSAVDVGVGVGQREVEFARRRDEEGSVACRLQAGLPGARHIRQAT